LRYAQDFDAPTSNDEPGSQSAPAAKANLQTSKAPQAGSNQLTEVLKRELEQRGHQVAINIGIAGIFVDVAVLDSENSQRCIVGIALDGPNYQSARSARDRNRTFDGVLGAQGWSMHRIWSPEWFSRPQVQLSRLLDVIEAAQKGKAVRKSNRLASAVSKIERRAMATNPLELAVSEPEKLPQKPRRKTADLRKTESKAPADESTKRKSKSNVWASVWKGFITLGSIMMGLLKLVNSILTKLNQPAKKPTRRSPPRKKK
jgi:very-short-patch-repair endonuclease